MEAILELAELTGAETEATALLAGSDSPPTMEEMEDLTAPAPAPLHAEEPKVIKAEDVAEGEQDVIEELIAAAPEPEPPPAGSRQPRDHRPRDEAFADRVAQDRAREMLGDDFGSIIEGMTGAPVKVGEKVYNVLCHIAGRGKLSKFTAVALEVLMMHDSRTSGELVNDYITAGYKEGTARSQAQQMMAALPILKLAARNGNKIERVDDARLWKLLADASEGRVVQTPDPKSDHENLLADAETLPDGEAITEPDPDPESDVLAATPMTKGDHESLLADVLSVAEAVEAKTEPETTPEPESVGTAEKPKRKRSR